MQWEPPCPPLPVTPCTKLNAKRSHVLNARAKPTKSQQETRRALRDLGFENGVCAMPPKA